MANRLTLYMTLAVLGGFAIIMLMNAAALLGYIPPKYISPNDVRGIAVEHAGVMYTLNFDQQNTLIAAFNRSIPVSKESIESRKQEFKNAPDIQKIVIYRFNQPDIEIVPIAYVSKTHSLTIPEDEFSRMSFIFSAPQWNPDGFLEEATLDQLPKILSKTYDP